MKKDTGIRLTLVKANEWDGADGRHHRREEWLITGGEIDPAWRRDAHAHAHAREHAADWEPSSRFTLYVVDGEVDVRLASYGGAVWPTAWPALFETRGRYQRGVEITDQGLMFRSAALDGASDMYADVRLS